MKTRSAVLYEVGRPRPYAESRPLLVETLELDPLGEGGATFRHGAGARRARTAWMTLINCSLPAQLTASGAAWEKPSMRNSSLPGTVPASATLSL